MTTAIDRLVERYLADLERHLEDVPARRRREIVTEIEEHLRDVLAELGPGAGEADVRNALDRIGDPEDIAAEARERFGIARGRPSWTDPLAIVLLLIGGFLWFVGWIAGVVLLWLSVVWSVRDKVIATLLVPGGLLAPVLLLLVAGLRTTTCSTEQLRGGVVATRCTTGAGGVDILGVALLVLLIVAPISVAIHLGRALRRARRLAG